MFWKNKTTTALPSIVNMMAEYLSQEEEKTKSSIISMEDIQNKYDRLVDLGLRNSTNAKELKTIIGNQNIYNENILKAKSLIEYIKQVNQVLERNSYLISFEQFESLCKKYNLVYNVLENFTGVIPEENISQLEKILPKIVKLDNINNDLYFVISAEIKEESVPFEQWIKNNRILYLPSLEHLRFESYHNLGYGEVWNSDIVKDYPNCPTSKWPVLDCVRVKKLHREDFLIAALKDMFKDDFKITRKTRDPIVFQICPYGILIHSVWGEEADDEVLQKYKKTLNL